MPSYIFKALPEAGWAIFVAVATVVLTELITLDINAIDDPLIWGAALLAASVRAAAGAALAFLRPGSGDETPPDPVSG